MLIFYKKNEHPKTLVGGSCARSNHSKITLVMIIAATIIAAGSINKDNVQWTDIWHISSSAYISNIDISGHLNVRLPINKATRICQKGAKTTPQNDRSQTPVQFRTKVNTTNVMYKIANFFMMLYFNVHIYCIYFFHNVN